MKMIRISRRKNGELVVMAAERDSVQEIKNPRIMEVTEKSARADSLETDVQFRISEKT